MPTEPQIWVRDSASFELLGYGGNASPFPWRCRYPPGYAPYMPSLLRIERVETLLVGNVITQRSGKSIGAQCGIFDTGFAGTFYDPAVWRTILEVGTTGNFSTPPLVWPVLYARGQT